MIKRVAFFLSLSAWDGDFHLFCSSLFGFGDTWNLLYLGMPTIPNLHTGPVNHDGFYLAVQAAAPARARVFSDVPRLPPYAYTRASLFIDYTQFSSLLRTSVTSLGGTSSITFKLDTCHLESSTSDNLVMFGPCSARKPRLGLGFGDSGLQAEPVGRASSQLERRARHDVHARRTSRVRPYTIAVNINSAFLCNGKLTIGGFYHLSTEVRRSKTSRR